MLGVRQLVPVDLHIKFDLIDVVFSKSGIIKTPMMNLVKCNKLFDRYAFIRMSLTPCIDKIEKAFRYIQERKRRNRDLYCNYNKT